MTKNSKLPTTINLPIKELPKFWTRYELMTGNEHSNLWKLKSKLTKKEKREIKERESFLKNPLNK